MSRQKDLMACIPPEVLARARKGGAKKVDWYAGRTLDDGAVRSWEPSPQILKADHALLLANHKRLRKELRRERRQNLFEKLWRHMSGRVAPVAE